MNIPGIGGMFFVMFLAAPLLRPDTLYSTLPSATVPNEVSLGYQATQTAEFGGLIQLSGNNTAILDSVTVAMSNWAIESTYETVGTSTGFNIPLTLDLYDVEVGNSVGTLLDSITVSAFIPWRPEPDPAYCGAGSTAYEGSDGNCYNGSLSTVTFNLAGVSVPNALIYGLAYNTESFGADPYGVDGPYDSLNFALSSDAPTAGTDPLPGTAYWNTSTAGNYADGGAAGTGTFRQDQNWAPYSGAIEFDGTVETSEPTTLALFVIGICGLSLNLKNEARRPTDWHSEKESSNLDTPAAAR